MFIIFLPFTLWSHLYANEVLSPIYPKGGGLNTLEIPLARLRKVTLAASFLFPKWWENGVNHLNRFKDGSWPSRHLTLNKQIQKIT